MFVLTAHNTWSGVWADGSISSPGTKTKENVVHSVTSGEEPQGQGTRGGWDPLGSCILVLGLKPRVLPYPQLGSQALQTLADHEAKLGWVSPYPRPAAEVPWSLREQGRVPAEPGL